MFFLFKSKKQWYREAAALLSNLTLINILSIMLCNLGLICESPLIWRFAVPRRKKLILTSLAIKIYVPETEFKRVTPK